MSRRTHVIFALGTIAVGLLVHGRGESLGPVARDVIGDALWAAMIFWWVSAAAPRSPRLARATIALLICATVEVSQLSHAPMLVALRATRLGALVLGNGFDPRDLASYALGVVAATIIETRFVRPVRRTPAAHPQ